jgi:hypothetical protein
MNTNHNLKKKLVTSALGAAAAAVAAPAVLFAGAGIAQAQNPLPPPAYTNDLFGPVAWIFDPYNGPGQVEWCTYHSNLSGQPGVLPFDAPVSVDGNTVASQLQIPGIQTGTQWDVTVTCPSNSGWSGQVSY